MSLKEKIINLLKISKNIKAKDIAHILTNEFSMKIDRSDVNSTLYKMRAESEASVNNKFEWSLSKNIEITNNNSPESSIVFTEEQQGIIDLDTTGHLLVRGQAGSGKTTILAARLGKIVSSMNNGSILFLTYNSALCSYVQKSFANQGINKEINVQTFHEWAKTTASKLDYNFLGWVTTSHRNEQLKKIIEEFKKDKTHRLFNLDDNEHLLSWWSDEISWLFGQFITRFSEYEMIERIGRGTNIRLNRDDREVVWDVFEEYVQYLEEEQKEDYDNPGGLLLKVKMITGKSIPEELKYDHIFIDEVQDFDKSWLMAISEFSRFTISLAGDIAQKIYKRNFTWESVGIKIHGSRSRYLTGSHRTTKQIMNVAKNLLKGMDFSQDLQSINQLTEPKKNGELVNKIICNSPKEAYDKGYEYVSETFKRLRKKTVALVVPFKNQMYPAMKALEKKKLNVQTAKGKTLGRFTEGIVVTTFHQLKGLEFDHVIIMGLHDSQYPGKILKNIPKEELEIEENIMKRVLYVAMTRAKETVTLVGSEPFCRFFNEIPEEYFNKITN